MEAINFIKQYHKLYIGNIDYSILDNNKNSYFYYETLINSNIYNYNNTDNIIYRDFKNHFLIISIDNNNNINLKLYLQNKFINSFQCNKLKIKNNIIYFKNNIISYNKKIIINILFYLKYYI